METYKFLNEEADVATNPDGTPTNNVLAVRRYTNSVEPTVTPVPTGSPTVTPAPTAYNGSPIASKPTLGTVDENQIREETRKRMQASIDAIDANYTNLIAQEKITGEDRSGQTRAINARSGTSQSDFGNAQQEKTTQFNKNQVKYLEDEKNAKVQSVLQNIEDRAAAQIKAKKDEALQKYQIDMGEFEKAQESARNDFASLAKSGFDINKLNPAQKAALLKQAGYDEDIGELIYNAMKPAAQKIDYKFEKLADGRGMFYGVDPVTGQLVTKEVSMDIPDDMSLTIAPDGTPILFNKTTGEARVADGFNQGQFAKPEDSEQLYGGLTKDQRTELQRVQSNVRQDPDVKDFVQIRDGFERVQTGANRDDAQGDLALLFGYMKILDPNSVVRETEFANAEQAQGTLQRVMNLPDKFIKGTRLTSEARKHFADAAKDLYARKEQSYQKAFDFYGGQLDAFDIPRDLGLRDFGTTFEDDSPSQLTPLNGNDPRRFTNPLIGKYPYLEVAQFIGEYPDATEAEIKELVGGSEGTNPKARAFSPTISKTLASTLTSKFPEGSIGPGEGKYEGQCGVFVRNIAKQFGLNYPTLGDSLTSKISAVKKYGTTITNAKIGSVIVTKENPTYGHVAWIIGKNKDGFIVAESNFKQSKRVSYGRVIPFNSSKIIGLINPKSA